LAEIGRDSFGNTNSGRKSSSGSVSSGKLDSAVAFAEIIAEMSRKGDCNEKK
jgi:hypothetical protein